jgi:signal transduction histidine kinase
MEETDDRAAPTALWDDDLLARTRSPRVVNQRADRFRGEALTAPMSALVPDDRAIARGLYDWLREIEDIAGALGEEASARLERLRAHLAAHPVGRQLRAMQAFGRATAAQGENALLGKVVHDVRGGPLTGLMMMLQRVEAGRVGPAEMLRVHFRVRDHRKIMRGALLELDDVRRERDRALKRHDVQLLVEKWSGARVPVEDDGGGARVVVVRLDHHFDGSVCESCIEFTALDRVLYNLTNNALRHARDGGVHVVLSAVPAEAPVNLHVAVANRVDPAAAAALRARFGDDLGGLFYGGYSTTGSGLGLSICADMVGNAFGVDDPEACDDEGYVGALLADGIFGAWFHWPLVAD